MYDRLVAVSCWMPEASSRVPPELSCQTEEKNRCREINVFLDVNRIWPKNPYIKRIPEISWCSSTTQRVHVSRRPSVFCRWLPRRWFPTSSIRTFIRRRSMIFCDGLEKAVSVSRSFFLPRLAFAESTQPIPFIGWNTVGNCVILFIRERLHTRIVGAVDARVLWRLRVRISHVERCRLVVDFGASFQQNGRLNIRGWVVSVMVIGMGDVLWLVQVCRF